MMVYTIPLVVNQNGKNYIGSLIVILGTAFLNSCMYLFFIYFTISNLPGVPIYQS